MFYSAYPSVFLLRRAVVWDKADARRIQARQDDISEQKEGEVWRELCG